MVRLLVGPRASSSTKEPRAKKERVFDAHLPFDEEELEEMGAAMAFYTLGALADQPEVDLPGAEWGWNLKRALETPAANTLSERQLARREKILRRVR
jgi:hypothetical protein